MQDRAGSAGHAPFAGTAPVTPGRAGGGGVAGEPTGVDLDRDRGGAATVVAVVPPGWESWEDVPLSEDELWELRFGDDGGDLSAEQLDALMARLPAGALDDPEMDGDGDDPPGAPGMLGLMPRDVPAGGGFDAGGVADRLPPGLALAALAERTWQAGLARLDDDELVGLALAWRRLQSWATAAELAAIAALASRRDRQAAAAGDAGIAEHFGDELAMAMTLTGRSAAALLDFATAMATLPATSNALAAGVIDRGKAHVIADELSGLDRVQAARVEAQLLGNAGSQTTSQLRAAAKRTVLKTDPAAAKKRHEAARRNARVEVWHEPSGTASLAGRDLPPADVLAADQRITALARRLKATGHHGTLDQLRAQAYTSLLLGHPADGPATAEHSAAAGNRATATEAGTTTAANAKAGTARAGTGASRSGTPHAGPGGTGPPGTAAAGTARDGTGTCGSKPPHARPVGTGSASTGSAGTAAPGTAAPGTATVGTAAVGTGTASNGSPGSPQEAQPSGLRGSVNLTVPLATLLGISESPGDLAGLGPIHADDARALAAALATRPGNRWCLTLTGPDGRAIAHGCTTTAAKRTTNRAGKVGGDESGSGGGRGHGDSSGGDRGGGGNGGGRGGGGGGGGGSSGGRGGGSSGGDRGGGGNGGGRGGGRGGGGGSSGGRGGGGSSSGETGASSTGPPWPLTFNLTPLATGTCSHRLETAGYHPTHLLRHTLHVRQRTCSAPGCRRQAVNCDLDHTTPYAKGGRTCECGLAPLCRRHHRAKQTYGWKLEQPHPGVLVWRLPHGRTYRVEPDPYPV